MQGWMLGESNRKMQMVIFHELDNCDVLAQMILPYNAQKLTIK